MTLGSTQPLTEMRPRNLLGDKGRPARKALHATISCIEFIVAVVLIIIILMNIYHLFTAYLMTVNISDYRASN
jgi:hypothetical protein